MASKSATKANKSSVPAESDTTGVESGTVVTEPAVDGKALFAAYDQADADLKALEASVDAAKQHRSDAVKAIAKAKGNGPFDYNGKLLSVTTRTETKVAADGESVEVLRYFFKGNRKAVQVI